MLSRMFQSVISQMAENLHTSFGVFDDEGTILACSDLKRQSSFHPAVNTVDWDSEELQVIDGETVLVAGRKKQGEFCIFIEGTDEATANYARLIRVSLLNIYRYYDEKYDKTEFVKSIILSNIMPGDVYVRARELHLLENTSRVVFLVSTRDRTEYALVEVLQNLFPDRNNHFVVSVDSRSVAVVKDVRSNVSDRELEQTAQTIVHTVSGEMMLNVVVGIGNVVDNIQDLAVSFKDARMAIDVGKVFEPEKTVINYNNLGIGRLVYQLPTTLCQMFLSEIFKKKTIDNLSPDIMYTIQEFFKNDLNVSKTAESLYVHRNTLVYRLEKVKRLTGLDLRVFEHAVVFKVALMVKKYLDANPMGL